MKAKKPTKREAVVAARRALAAGGFTRTEIARILQGAKPPPKKRPAGADVIKKIFVNVFRDKRTPRRFNSREGREIVARRVAADFAKTFGGRVARSPTGVVLAIRGVSIADAAKAAETIALRSFLGARVAIAFGIARGRQVLFTPGTFAFRDHEELAEMVERELYKDLNRYDRKSGSR